MKENFFSKAAKFLKQDFNTSLSVGYLVLVIIGMLFDGFLYWSFGINIVQYSDISDFLLAPFRNPKILIFIGGTFLILYLIGLFNDWMEKKYPKLYDQMYIGMDKKEYEKRFSKKGEIFIIVTYILLAASAFGRFETKKIKKILVPETELSFKDNKFEANDTLIYIGKTNGYVFLYNRTKKQTDVVPIGDVLKIEMKK
jgi:hypothetical protein